MEQCSSVEWFSSMAMEDPGFFDHYDVAALQTAESPTDEFGSSDHYHRTLSAESHINSYAYLGSPRPALAAARDTDEPARPAKSPRSSGSWSSQDGVPVVPAPSPPAVISFGRTSAKRAVGAQEHILAERKRREKLSERFIALSAVVPGLKKTDKASVLADAVRYVKQLQEKVKKLEERTARTTVESVVLVKKSQLPDTDEEDTDGASRSLRPEIEAKVSGRRVLLKIQCEKRKGVLVSLLARIESLHLSVDSASVNSFAGSILDVTIVAQMEQGFSATAADLVKCLNSTLRQLMIAAAVSCYHLEK